MLGSTWPALQGKVSSTRSRRRKEGREGQGGRERREKVKEGGRDAGSQLPGQVDRPEEGDQPSELLSGSELNEACREWSLKQLLSMLECEQLHSEDANSSEGLCCIWGTHTWKMQTCTHTEAPLCRTR